MKNSNLENKGQDYQPCYDSGRSKEYGRDQNVGLEVGSGQPLGHRNTDTVNYSFDDSVIRIWGPALTKDNCGSFVREAFAYIAGRKLTQLTIDISDLNDIDSAGCTAINYIRRQLENRSDRVVISGAPEVVEQKLRLFAISQDKQPQPIEKPGFMHRTGNRMFELVTTHIRSYISVSSELFYWSMADLFNKKHRRKGSVVNQAVLIGVNAVPIVGVMAFIIGLVLALQSASQLRNFGANIFIVDLTVIAMMAEMGPLITAIMVAGRSGSAIAAEIATMKVTNELDALQTMGFNPIRFAVVPKIYGSLITMPFLTTIANVCGIIGGVVAAYLYLDISPEVFFNRMHGAIYQKDILTGIIKSLVFGCIVVTTGAYFGFQVDKGAEGVGRSTTGSVVTAIALVIVADLILGLTFY